MFDISQLRNKPSHLVGHPFPAFEACFFSYIRLAFPEKPIESSLIVVICLEWLKLSLGAVLSPTGRGNRNYGTLKE